MCDERLFTDAGTARDFHQRFARLGYTLTRIYWNEEAQQWGWSVWTETPSRR